jgi:hypothetical protein
VRGRLLELCQLALAPLASAPAYLGFSVVFGPSVIRWADARFAHRFAGGPPPVALWAVMGRLPVILLIWLIWPVSYLVWPVRRQ